MSSLLPSTTSVDTSIPTCKESDVLEICDKVIIRVVPKVLQVLTDPSNSNDDEIKAVQQYLCQSPIDNWLD